jgi:CheY-like chemotaxis protein
VIDEPGEKDSHTIVPRVSGHLTRPASGLIHRGLLELASLGAGRGPASSSEKARVLVCDDEEAIVEVWGNTLLDAGYEVRSTLNAIEAIEIARTFRPHLALLGLIMPRMDGIKLGLELTKVLPQTKVVIMTQSEPIELETLHDIGCAFDNLSWHSTKDELLEKTRGWTYEAMLPKHPRIMVVSTEEAVNEVVPDLLNRNGCIAIATGTKRKDGWPVYEIIEEAKTFRPDVVFLLHNLQLWPKMTGVDLAILLLENFPGAIFLVGRFADGQFTVSGEALAYARSHGCRCETVNIPFEVDDILTKIGTWNAERGPTK